MSDLKLFCPVESDVETDRPTILPFRRPTNRIAGQFDTTSVVGRARVLFENRRCTFCNHEQVEPIELDDAVISRRNHRPIPGTATIVGFHCHYCQAEWPIYEATRTIG